jgi:hypothetical protein
MLAIHNGFESSLACKMKFECEAKHLEKLCFLDNLAKSNEFDEISLTFVKTTTDEVSQKGFFYEEPAKLQIRHSVIYDCTWNGTTTKT